MNKDVITAKNLLSGNICFNCSNAMETWRLADDSLKCTKRGTIVSVSNVCYLWELVDPIELYEREFLVDKYKQNKEFSYVEYQLIKGAANAMRDNIDDFFKK